VDCGQTIHARTVVIASGAAYNKPNIDNLKKFEGQGVYYGATYIEAQLCGKGRCNCSRRWQLGRPGRGLSFANRQQSSYAGAVRAVVGHDVPHLIQRIEENPAIEMHYCTEIVVWTETRNWKK